MGGRKGHNRMPALLSSFGSTSFSWIWSGNRIRLDSRKTTGYNATQREVHKGGSSQIIKFDLSQLITKLHSKCQASHSSYFNEDCHSEARVDTVEVAGKEMFSGILRNSQYMNPVPIPQAIAFRGMHARVEFEDNGRNYTSSSVVRFYLRPVFSEHISCRMN